VRNDGSITPFSTTAAETFIIRASNGVGIYTNSPDAMLTVEGGIRPIKKTTDPC